MNLLENRVRTCYSVVDRFFPACGLLDLTEGMYGGDPRLSVEEAQAHQHDYLLDQLGCGTGTRILDVGCGYGTLLKRARQRGLDGVGISISPEQVGRCRREGLDVHLLDWRRLPPDWNGVFDGVVANGSIEHFAAPQDAATGTADAMYTELFAAVARVLVPGPSSRFVSTTIHMVRGPGDPLSLLRAPSNFPRGSDDYHWSVLEHGWGGYYPALGQLERCAAPRFALLAEQDGTADYRLTSEAWLSRVRAALRSWRTPMMLWRLLPVLLRAPRQCTGLLAACLRSESWAWQFRGDDPPTRLLRHTWQRSA